MDKYNKYNIQSVNNISNGKCIFSKKYSTHILTQKTPVMYYIMRGNGIVWVDKIKYNVSEHQSIFVRPSSECSFECGDEECEILFVCFTGVEYMWLISHTAFTSGLSVTQKIDLPDPEKLFNITVDGKGEIYQNARINAKLCNLLSYYIEYFPATKEEYNRYVLSATKYIELNYRNSDFTATDVSNYLKLDRSYLYKLFKAEMGVSVHDYINKLRISRAGSLLASSNLSIKDVATESGFADQMYFSRLFKKKKNLTPSQYRQYFKDSQQSNI
ncbi:AraC family transcriptional regulator [Ruminococcus sp.]|uniref:AraC family transcriptional regulator n=1 Tax=Ruminococcus sp. TaxID=41978 RepID=UPI00386AF598